MKIPVLMYHSISNLENKSSLSTKVFEKQMKIMKYLGFETTDLVKFTNNKKKFIVTFDDGYEDVFLNALPILKKYNFQAICFFVTDYIGKTNLWDSNLSKYTKMKIMNKDQIKHWHDCGMIVGSHTKNHINLKSLSDFEKYDQMKHPIDFFKEKFNIKVNYFSYPFGAYDQKSLQIGKSMYKYSFTTNRGRFDTSFHSQNEIPRVPINKKDNLLKFFIKTQTIYEDI